MQLTTSERDKMVTLLKQPDISTFALLCGLMVAQAALMATVDSLTLGTLTKIVLFGAPVTQALYMVSLEFANNLCFGNEILDRCAAIMANFCTGVPYAELVRGFTAEHFAFHNSSIYKDPEDPSELELTHINGAGMKLAYLALYPLFYVHRLLFRHTITFTRYLVWNVALQLFFNTCILYWYGGWALFYVLASTYVGMSPAHPCAFHFITSHRQCVDTVDLNPQTRTYSYYGIMNAFTLNAGYHRERHLFRNVPWSRLPLIRQLYFFSDSPTAYYDSVLQAIHDFIFNPGMTLHT